MFEPFLGRGLGIAVEFIGSLAWLIFIAVVSFNLIKMGPSCVRRIEMLVPPEYRYDYICLREEINHIWGAFFRGQIILAAVVATLFTLIGLALGLPFPLAMGILRRGDGILTQLRAW